MASTAFAELAPKRLGSTLRGWQRSKPSDTGRGLPELWYYSMQTTSPRNLTTAVETLILLLQDVA